MAGDTAKRYYWLKLQDGFFGSKRIKKLRKIAGGDTYTIIYLKMQLMAMKSNGVLEYTGLEQTFAEELALDLDEEADNVTITVNYLLSCGLLETSDNREYFLPYAVLNTGSEGASAKRVREHRERKALQCNADVAEVKQIGNGEIEKEKKIEKEINIDSEKKPPTRHKYGEYNNVLLSDEDMEKLQAEFPDWQERIERLSSYIASTGKTYKNHLATIRNWARKDKEQKPKGRKEITPQWCESSLDMEGFEEQLLKHRPVFKPKTAAEDDSIRARAEALQKQLAGN